MMQKTMEVRGAMARSSSKPDTTSATATFLQLLLPDHTNHPSYLEVDGPVDAEDTLIRYDVPFAPYDPKRSLRLRKSLGLPVETRQSDPNVRIILDRCIIPRRWKDESGVVWVQHASPFVTSRTDTLDTHNRLKEKLERYGAKRTGTCAVRTLLLAECFLEVIRQVVAECWERGLLLLHVHSERVAAQAAHREIFESRVGHAFRLALKGEKDTARVEGEITGLKEKIASLEEEEKKYRKLCADFSAYAEEQMLIENKEHTDLMAGLKKEGLIKKNQLEKLLQVPTQN